MNLKKLFATTLTVLMVATMFPVNSLKAGYAPELEKAYDYAYSVGATTMDTIETSNVYGQLIRSHMAKMLSAWAKEVLGLTPDTSKDCEFTDVADVSEELQGYITESCQLGLMGVGITKFRPNDKVTRAEFGTVLSRALRGDKYDGGTPYYADHLAALNETDPQIMTDISNPSAFEVRGYVRLMMQRADEGDLVTPSICLEDLTKLACLINPEDDACPVECRDIVIPNEDAKGTLDVSMDSSNGGDVPYGISSLPVATYEFTADEDIRLDSVIVKRAGYFDSATIPNAALFLNGGRISKVANFSSSTDEATLTITNGYEVKAGETVKLAVHVSILNSTDANGEQFNVKVLSVDSTAEDVNLDSDLTSDTFKIVNQASPTLTVNSGSTSDDPKLGQTAADLFEFTLDNPSSSDDADITLNSITFKENGGTIDEGDDLENFELVVDGSTVATAEKMEGKYLIFNLEDGYVIRESKTPVFTVKADVIGGAGKTIMFILDNAMDIVAIGDKYDQPVNIWGAGTAMDTVTVSAGKVTLNRTNTTSTDLLGNRDNLFLGSFEIVNNAGEALTLQTLKLAMTGNVNVLDTVKVRLGSTSASPIELTSSATGTLWSETSLEKAIGSKLVVYVYADTIDTGMNNKTLRMSLNTTYAGGHFLIQESSDDTNVTDISPNSLTWSQMVGTDAGLTLTNVILADKTVAEGTNDIDVIKFKIKAGSAYGVKLKKLTFGGSTGVLDSDTVSAAKLYRGTTEIPATVKIGSIVVDEDITITKGTTAEFTLKVDVQLNPDLNSFSYSLAGNGIEAEDTSEDKNTIITSGLTTINGRTVTINAAGEIVAAYETTADNNKYTKNILAGNTAVVSEYSLYSKYEVINVGKAVVTFDGEDADDSALDVQLRYNGEEVASNPVWSATGSIATFDDLDFDTLTTKAPLLVKVVSKVIDEDGGATLASRYVSEVTLDTMVGKDSGDEIAHFDIGDNAKVFGIVPVTINPNVPTIGAAIADLNLVTAVGTNKKSDGTVAKGTLVSIVFTLEGSNGILNKIFVKDSDNTTLGSIPVTADNDYTVTLSGSTAKEVAEGTTTLKVTTSLTGSTVNPSYSLSVKTINYYTNVDGAGVTLDARFGGSKTILVK